MRTRAIATAATWLLLLTACSLGSPDAHNRVGPRGCKTSTTLGAVSGTDRNGLCVFRGIPYAAAPVGVRRFRPPQPAPPWHGTLKATDDEHVCPQNRDVLTEDYANDTKVFTDEDCLHLNVWTPRPDRRKRPVIVFVHGGAARFGTANEPRYDGTELATEGEAVVVSLNYRLGVLGWTELGGLDPAYRGSGNNGLRDQIAALKWVRDHIADFGGDPNNVTAVGESEGAFSLAAMLATDHPERLFRRVVLQSGSGYLVHTREYARETAARLPVTRVAELKSMSTRGLLALQEKTLETTAPGVLGAVYFGPHIDGELVRDSVINRITQGNAKGVDILIGTNRDEVNFFGQFGPGQMGFVADQYEKVFFPKSLAPRLRTMTSVYRKGRSAREARLAMFTDQGLRVPATRLAEAQSRWRPTYMYEFAWQPPKGYGAVHTIELPFMFGTLRFSGVVGGAAALNVDRKRMTTLSHQMIDAWTSFARTGNPSTRRTIPRPDWPAYRVPERATMIWDIPAKVSNDPRGGEREQWSEYSFNAFAL
ncbi:carboxylesterase/lipase family protein [Actinomadura sp. NPDC023710]|uniref:carboxylesterase/lipase family protein n=1 Tax=Actinomadura sp. NPDC023710 TaxID=3158219 RepID=UPI0033F5C88C